MISMNRFVILQWTLLPIDLFWVMGIYLDSNAKCMRRIH